MNRRPFRIPTAVAHAAACATTALLVACAPFMAPPPPSAGGGPPALTPTMTIDAASAEGARAFLSGRYVSDYARTLVSAPTRWLDPVPPAGPEGGAHAARRRLQALGDAVDPDWPAAGLNLRMAPFNLGGTDRVTNGQALRDVSSRYPKRLFLITQNGVFLDLDPANPTVGYARTVLGGTYTKTYVSLSADGSTAFVVSDAGVVTALNTAILVPGSPPSHRTKAFNLGAGAVGAALFIDPLTANLGSGAGTLHVVDNGGGAHRLVWTGTGGGLMSDAKWTAATLTRPWPVVALPASAPATSAAPIGGGVLFKAPPVVLNHKLVIGDRAGNVIHFAYNPNAPGGTKSAWTVNYGWPIETPCAVDIDDAFNLTDVFAAAGAQLFWVKPATGSVYTGQYALVENGGNEALVDASNFPAYVNTTQQQLAADATYKAFSASVGAADAIGLPGSVDTPNVLDSRSLSYAGFVSGLPPTISNFAGAPGRKFHFYYPWNPTSGTPPAFDATGGQTGAVNTNPPGVAPLYQVSNPVVDGTATTAAQLLSPSAIEFDDDGSYFVADTNHAQVLFTPGTATSWQNWFPAAHTMAVDNAASEANFYWGAARPDAAGATSNFYVFAGTLFGLPGGPMNDGAWGGQDRHDPTGAVANRWRDIGNGTVGLTEAAAVRQGGRVNAAAAIATGAAAGAVARGCAINRPQGLAVGNLGLYIANRNMFQFTGGNLEGQILFMPRRGVTSAWGLTNLEPGRLYVICNFVDPQGIDVWRVPGGTRDLVFAPSMGGAGGNAPSSNRIVRLDSSQAPGARTLAACTIAGTGAESSTGDNGPATAATVQDPYDVGLDDGGNLFIAEHGSGKLRMIAKAVSAAEGAATGFAWGTAGVAGRMYAVKTGLTEICSVSFAANDPQIPAGQRCIYIGLGAVPDNQAPASSPNRVIRLDQTLYHAAVAGPSYGSRTTGFAAADYLLDGDAGDGASGDAAAVRLTMPWRARGRFNVATGNYETYVCDRGNNRIRLLTSSAGTTSAQGFVCLPWPTGGTAHWGKPIYSAALTLYAKASAGTLGVPTVALASARTRGTNVLWDHTNAAAEIRPTRTPTLDKANGLAFPFYPAPGASWNFLAAVTGAAAPPYGAGTNPYRWYLPAQLLFTSATNPEFQHLRLGLETPSDSNFYFFPGSPGTVSAPNVKSPDFYGSNPAALPAPAANYRPRVDYWVGNRNIAPILSPPAIVYRQVGPGAYDGTRYVYLMNANALWRYDVTSVAAFTSGAAGAKVAFAKTVNGRPPGGTIYNQGALNVFQFNPTAPLVGLNGRVYAIDIKATGAATYDYALNSFDGDLATTNPAMYVGARTVGTNVATSSPTDNAGIYLTADAYISEAYFGLADGKIYRMDLESEAP